MREAREAREADVEVPLVPGVRVAPLGDAAVVVELGDRLDVAVSRRAARLATALRDRPPPGVVGALATLAAVLVHYDPLAADYDDVVARATARLASSAVEGPSAAVRRRVVLPTCYAPELGPDLDGLADAVGLGRDDLVALHAGRDYQVFMIGFLPGFPYMGPVAAPLRPPRRATPRARVPARSVAVAGGLTAVYPVTSPGGWPVVGAVPVDLFSPMSDPPCLLAAGDTVRFTPVGRAHHDELRAAWTAGEWVPIVEET